MTASFEIISAPRGPLALLVGPGETENRTLSRASLAAGHDEKWLQALLFQHPELIPIDTIDPGATQVIPVCRELSIPKEGSTVFLDMLGITPQGRLVLVECKLWRNPQARREVIAQILEYAALLRRWSYADLTARLKALQKLTGANPLFDIVRRFRPDLDESTFVDRVSNGLAAGDFDLIVAGDGIRSDLQAIAAHLTQYGQGARLALLEIQLWNDSAGQMLVVPTLPFRTEVVQQRVIVGPDNIPLQIEPVQDASAEADAVVNPDLVAGRNINRTFWDRFITTVRFDHPDQTAPRHGGNNWVRIDMPKPATWLTAYRTGSEAGLFLTLAGDDGLAAFDELLGSAETLSAETGLSLSFVRKSEAPFKGTVTATLPYEGGMVPSDEVTLEWLRNAANALVNAFRPRLAAWSRE